MSFRNNEFIVTIDAKRVVAITLLAVISVYTWYSYAIALFAFIAPYPNISDASHCCLGYERRYHLYIATEW